ncbi:MAG: hypothetical protein ABIS47_10405 [Acidimicrobiales bacterium]
MIVVVPLSAPVADDVQLLEALPAVKTSCADVLMLVMLVELVTDPEGPVAPWVLTVSGPDEKNLAGPTRTLPVGSEAVIGMAEPPGGSVTTGLGPCVVAVPPKRLTLAW